MDRCPVRSSPLEDPGGDEIVAEINVTPLTDIFLVLLIIFMVTSTALTQQATRVNLPRAQSGPAGPTGVVVTATADHRLAVNGKTVGLDGLAEALQAALASAPEKSVILQGDRSVVLEDAVRIMTVAKSAGAERIAIATESEGTGAPR